MNMKVKVAALALAGAAAVVGCDPEDARARSPRVGALDASAWSCSQWISAKDAPTFDGEVLGNSRAADGTSWFAFGLENAAEVVSAKWMTAGLGVYEVYVNGLPVGDDFLKPGFTHNAKTKYAFTYDVTKLVRSAAGERNVFAAEVSAGWWRDKICTPAGQKGFAGRKSAFRGVLELTFADGTKRLYGTSPKDWRAGTAGSVTHAAIFDGEEFDARIAQPYDGAGLGAAEVNDEFKGELLPTAGAEIVLRRDLAVVRGPYALKKGETLVVDFGQNCAAVPEFRFAAKAGTVLTALPAEMINDADKGQRGCDGPKGSAYRANLRVPKDGMRLVYTFADGGETVTYHPRFTFFGYRYVSITATDDVAIDSVASIPVTSIAKDLELGRIETGDACVNRLISNVYWGQLSNYLSVPTDCPQRNERLGWTADTQVFVEAGAFNADTLAFFHKWMRDMRDSQDARGGFPGVAPFAQYGNVPMRVGWADAGVIVPYKVWCQFGDRSIIEENWAAMERYLARCQETRYEHAKIADECGNYQWADWLSFEKLESAGGAGKPQNSAFEPNPDGKGRRPKADALLYWDFLGACYWMWDAEMMAEMARAIRKDAQKYVRMAAEAKAYIRGRFFATDDGMILPVFRDMQTPALFALKLGLVEGAAKERTVKALCQNFKDNGGCLQTGFLGTSILMDTLTENGLADVAYALLLNHGFPGWLYSVDQGATTIWERWNSYTKEKGFGPVGMNSFNHYAYGAVLAWIYRTAAGIAADPKHPGFRNVIMAPKPDRRLGHVKASYRSAAGLIRSEWSYEGDEWVWEFEIPRGATASVTVPGETKPGFYAAGVHRIVRKLGQSR